MSDHAIHVYDSDIKRLGGLWNIVCKRRTNLYDDVWIASYITKQDSPPRYKVWISLSGGGFSEYVMPISVTPVSYESLDDAKAHVNGVAACTTVLRSVGIRNRWASIKETRDAR